MTWQKVTAMIPPANDSLLEDLYNGAYKNSCYVAPGTCPRIQSFLYHHIIKKAGFPAKKRVKTMAGNQIWWMEIDNERFVMPEGIKVIEVKSADNGEVWYIERSLI
jgi:hypothetical protein